MNDDNEMKNKDGESKAPARPRRMMPPPPPMPKTPATPPAAPAKAGSEAARKPADTPDPTRFGDWEKKGRCIDF